MMTLHLVAALCVGFACTEAALAANTGIDCLKARTPDEHTICRNYELGQLDARMTTLFDVTTSLVGMGQRGIIRDDQASWLERRHACRRDIACLHQAYAARIEQLQKVVDRIASHGPY